jgi:hypothetical protein
MNGLLLDCDRLETGENRVGVACVRAEVEDRIEIDPRSDLVIVANKLAEVEFFIPGAHRVALHEPVRLVAPEAGLDECEQYALAEEQEVARFEIAAHALFAHDEPLHQPREPIEHVIDGEKGVGHDDPLRRRVRDVALVPERDVLEADHGGCADNSREPADALRYDRVALVGHCR